MMTGTGTDFLIGVPTYRRPDMLHRALRSLINQSHPNWFAIVFDDSPDQEGKTVVTRLDDKRIRYTANRVRDGAAVNIDRIFSAEYFGLCKWGALLEDDNYYLPDYLHLVVSEMSRVEAKIALFNQRIDDESSGLLPPHLTTRGDWFSTGWIAPYDLHSSLLLMEGLSNGGLVWRMDSGVRLQVGSAVKYTSLHEACRSLLVSHPLWYCGNAHAVWTKNRPSTTARSSEKNRIVSRGRQSIIKKVIELHGASAVTRALHWTTTVEKRRGLINSLAHAGCWSLAWKADRTIFLKNVKFVFKGIVSRAVTHDPCRDFIKNIK